MRIADELQVDCPVFYIDNVAAYYHAHAQSIRITDLPSFRPPFADMWVEYRNEIGARAAARLTDRTHLLSQLRAEGATSLVCMDLFANGDRAPFMFLLWFDSDGKCVRSAVSNGRHSAEDIDGAEAWIVRPVLLAISFMHCKNVRHVETVPRIDKKFLRATGKKPRLKFYTLEIDPMKETLRREGNVESVGLAKALHICRGHFKDYRQSGLFGKIKGIFWWGPALRGTPEAGAVVKDYAVKAPVEPGETVH